MNINQAKDIVRAIAAHNIEAKADGADVGTLMTPQLIGDPGLGKTAIPRQAAEELGIEFASIIVAQYDSGELGGMPYLDEASTGKQYARARPDWLPSEGEGILLLDELSQAPLANLNIVAQLVNEHRIGEHKLGDGWTIVVANNHLSNRAGTVSLPTHLKDRLMPIEVEANLDDTIKHFNEKGVNPLLVSFLRVFPQRLAEFEVSRDACPSPRSWMRVNTLLSMLEKKALTAVAFNYTTAGTVGIGASTDLATHMMLHDKMVDPETCIRDPHSAELPEDVSVSYILCAALSARANESNIGNILKYADRLKHQDQVAFLVKDALMRSGGKESKLLKAKDMKQWLQTNGKELVL